MSGRKDPVRVTWTGLAGMAVMLGLLLVVVWIISRGLAGCEGFGPP